MHIDVIVLAGGRSCRLGGQPKAGLLFEGRTLLDRTLAAVPDAGRMVIVGDPGRGPLASGTTFVREEPAFGGPAAAIGAGLAALPDPTEFVLVLACDMPGISGAIAVLLDAAGRDGAIAVDGGRPQYLAGAYRASSLRTALARQELDGLSVRRLVSPLDLVEVAVPGGSTSDIDTWDDAARHGVLRPKEWA